MNIVKPGRGASDLAARLGCTMFQAALLEMRGVTADTADDEINKWLAPDMEELLAKVDLGASNSDAAEIFRGLGPESEVIVYGDYDVDGISATTIAIEMSMFKGAHTRYFIPHRYRQGYGLHEDIAGAIAKRKCSLVVIVDCGSQDIDAVNIIKKSGIPVVILDHHLIEGETAGCDTIVNPQMRGDSLAKCLCAAAVIWCWGWQNELLPHDRMKKMLDLVALATVADCVSLASPLNRSLVREGINVMRRSPRPGLAILMEKLMINPKSLCTEDMAMKIIPCLNAAGRLYLADLAVKILFPGKDLPAQVDKLIELNQKRRELSTKILEEVDSSRDTDYQYVLSDPGWFAGVLSSVASRICNERNAPVALAASIGDMMRGTLRMPSGGDAVGLLSRLDDMLSTWGGHRLAAGFSVTKDKWPELRDEMEQMLSQVVVREEKEDLLQWKPNDLSISAWNECQALGPFGMENPAPLLYSPYSGNIRVLPLGRNGKHVKIDVGGSTLLGFGAAEMIRDRDSLAGWVYKPRLDTWHNVISLQLVLEKMVVL